MGNLGAVHCCNPRRMTRHPKRRKSTIGSTMNTTETLEGIKTIGADNSCDLSNNSDLCICLVTWNMNGQVTYEDLVELVGNKRRFDLLVVGLQETPRTEISKMLKSAMAETHILLGKAVMKSLQLYVFGPKRSAILTKGQPQEAPLRLPTIPDPPLLNLNNGVKVLSTNRYIISSLYDMHAEVKVDKYSLGGLGGLIRRQKGAVAIRINFKGIQMLFISCHLSAHEHNVEERNSQCRHISHSLFSKDWNPYSQKAQMTVWLGDLNYRLRGVDSQLAKKLIQNDLHRLLIGKDQLLQETERGEIFNGYCEGTLTFKPTYKYDIGSSDYDTSYKVRVPAWTDRILFKIEDSDKVDANLHSYESVDSIKSSDHKPVKAHLCLRVYGVEKPLNN